MTGFKRSITSPAKLTPQVQRVRSIAREDPNAFAQSQLKVATKTGGLVDYQDNWTQQQMQKVIDEEVKARKPLRIYFLKSRRVGSSLKILYRFFVKTWAQDNLEALVLSQEEERSEELLERIKLCYALLAPHLRLNLNKDSKSGIQYADTRSKVTVASARNLTPARGGTKQLLLFTEFAMIKKCMETLIEFHSPISLEYGTEVFLETTGRGYQSEAHQFWEDSKKGRTAFRAHFLDWRQDPTQTHVFKTDKERDLLLGAAFEYEPRLKDRMRHCGLTAGQTYHSYKIFKDIYNGDFGKYLEDYPADDTEPWLSHSHSYFGVEQVNRLRQNVKELPHMCYYIPESMAINQEFAEMTDFTDLQVVSKVEPNGSRPYFKVFANARENQEYVVSGDSSDGVPGGDFSSSFVVDQNTLEMMAEFHGHLRPDEHGYVMGFLCNVYNWALAVPELNPPGNVTFNTLCNFYNNMYRWKNPLMDNVSGNNQSRKLGWYTNAVSRPMMLEFGKRIAQDIANDRLRLKGIIRSPELVEEFGTFAPNEQGRAEAINNAYDDRVVAWCIAVYVANQETHGTENNILTLYERDDLDPLPREIDIDGMRMDPRDVIRELAQRFLSPGYKGPKPENGWEYDDIRGYY